jgi:RNA polymerase sigma-70 factor (ECF subfamily)
VPTENATWTLLRDVLAERYDELRARLARWLGSDELARESLNETWLRLHREDQPGPVHNPAHYVLRTAANIATDWRRGDRRRAKRLEVREILELASSAPDAEREVGARQEFALLERAVNELPERTRRILIAARLQGRAQQEIAAEFGMSTRMVRLELRRALDFCESEMQKGPGDRFLSRPVKSSS